MDLATLEKKRDAYATKITGLAIRIAVVFAVPALLSLGVKHWFGLSLAVSLPVAFLISWSVVIVLYRKIDREVRELEAQIIELKKQASESNSSLK